MMQNAGYDMDQMAHLFISYAGEDWVFADWLARKLAAQGYSVWFDRLRLLGGESYPKNIDDAIKKRTFRLIAILSHNSISKPNPSKERTLALNISRERNIDFLIPLNLDGLRDTELDWMTSDLTFIPFQDNWQSGLTQLLRKLQSLMAPKLQSNGPQLAATSYETRHPLHDHGEELISNIIPVVDVPAFVYRYRLSSSVSKLDRVSLQSEWAFRAIGENEVLSFQQPPHHLQPSGVVESERNSTAQPRIMGILASDVVSGLLYKTIWNEFLRLGCRQTPGERVLFFPSSALHHNRIGFRNYTGRPSYVLTTGARTFWSGGQKTTYHYHLCPELRIRKDLGSRFFLQLRAGLFFTDTNGSPLPSRSAVSRRKKLTRSWFNHEWLSRTLAIYSFLADGREPITIGDVVNGQAVVLGDLLRTSIQVGIDEDKNDSLDDVIDVTAEEVMDEEGD